MMAPVPSLQSVHIGSSHLLPELPGKIDKGEIEGRL